MLHSNGWLAAAAANMPTCQLAAAGVALVTNGASHHLLTGRLTYKTRQTSVPEYLSRHITTRSSTRSLRSSSAPLLHDELPSANALSAMQHHLSETLSPSPFRTVTRLHYLNLDLKHICSPASMLLNCPVRQRL